MTDSPSLPQPSAPDNAPVNLLSDGIPQSSWRDKKWTLLVWLVLILFLFRPLIWNDIQTVASPGLNAEGVRSTPLHMALTNFALDLLCVVIVCLTLFYLIVGRIGFIAINTFREAVRNRILYFILFFALILMGASGVVKELAIAAHDRIVMNLGLASISFFGLMASVFVGISLVYNELERRTIYTIVSKPVHRYQFLLGKFFGLLLTIYVIVAIMALFFFTVFNYQARTTDDKLIEILTVQTATGAEYVDNPALAKAGFLLKSAGLSFAESIGNLFGFEGGAVSHSLLIAVVMIGLELMIITAFAVMFSSFSTPTLSAVFTVMIFLAGRLNEDILRFADRLVQEAMKAQQVIAMADLTLAVKIKAYIAYLMALAVPNLDSLNVTSQVIHADTVTVWRYSVLYAILYTAAILSMAILIFSRRNFK